jgi:hypothetical protein
MAISLAPLAPRNIKTRRTIMVKFETALAGKTLELSVYAENIVRVRVSENFEPTLFERYGIYRKPDETGEAT